MATCFKTYDVRGRIPDELDENIAYAIGAAFVRVLKAKTVVIGRDVRTTSAPLQEALMSGVTIAGCDVLDIGLCGTEEVYFATSHYQADGGIMITASHNPIEYNGMKFVGKNSAPITRDNGLADIEDIVNRFSYAPALVAGSVTEKNPRQAYIGHLLSYLSGAEVEPLTVVMNPGNGCAGLVIDQIEKYLPIQIIKINSEPDGSFPNGIPNPLLPERRERTSKAVVKHGADLGIAWDGDFDRCFFFDHVGEFIEGYYVVGLLSQSILRTNLGGKVVHDPRLEWATREIVREAGGVPVRSKTGHALIKQAMREHDAVYGGEMSAHHYFRDFFYCDSGMIPWLLVVKLLSSTRKTLADLIREMKQDFPISGEINLSIENPRNVINAIKEQYSETAKQIDLLDGISVDMGGWRFNLRCSSTEPLVRLNVESRGNEDLLRSKTAELLTALDAYR